jgi:hypothetical protein
MTGTRLHAIAVVVLVVGVPAAAQQRTRITIPVDKVTLHPPTLDPLKDKPASGDKGEVGEVINKWYEAGEAAGNLGDVYYNRDGGHSLLFSDKFPQVQFVRIPKKQLKTRRYWGLCTSVVPHITVGNSSTASGPMRGGSNPRRAYTHPRALAVLTMQYLHSNLFVYPEHCDYDHGRFGRGGSRGGWGDLYPFNTPYLLISQGSSGSDRAFLGAVLATLAALPPETKQKLHKSNLLMPTVQMILRRCRKGVDSDQDYVSGAAHPTVFRGGELDRLAMVKMAHAIKPGRTPPISVLSVLEESESRPKVDYFLANRPERFSNTPCFVGRIYRGPRPYYRMVVSAEKSKDLNDRELAFHWAVLRGRHEGITIKPLNDDRSRVEIHVRYRNGRLSAPDQPGVEHARADIGCFVHNGLYYSPPAFISFYMPPNEYHTVDERGRVIEIGRGVVDTRLAPVPGLKTPLRGHHLIRHWDRLFGTVLADDRRGKLMRKWAGGEATVKAWRRAAEQFQELNRAYQVAKERSSAAWKELIAARKAEADNVDALKEESQQAKKRSEQADKALNDWLIQRDQTLGQTPQQLVEETLDALADQTMLLPGGHAEIAALGKRTARQAKAWLEQLVNLRIMRRDGEVYALNPLRSGAGSADARLTDYERATLRELNLRVLDVVLNGALNVPSANPVDQRVVLPADFRDVYHYSTDGGLKGWTRYYPGAEPQSFTAEGKLIMERDDAGAPKKLADVRYAAGGKRRHQRRLQMKVDDE